MQAENEEGSPLHASRSPEGGSLSRDSLNGGEGGGGRRAYCYVEAA